jgi:hypothetical protein
MLVDHALSRVTRGLVGKLLVEGQQRPEIFGNTATKIIEQEHREPGSQ